MSDKRRKKVVNHGNLAMKFSEKKEFMLNFVPKRDSTTPKRPDRKLAI